ncbi:MAG: SCO family protein [Chitinophagaceae bacterium]|nr:SCO family protein [Chitinophagaceae bacterium]
MSKKNWVYIGFFAVLVLCFYFVLTALIPDFGKRSVPPISYVRPFSFTDQDGKTFTNKNVEGKVYVTEYFFTTCKGICPIMNTNMKTVYDKFRDKKDFLILSHTSDPDVDSPAKLKVYSDSLGVSSSNWVFLTGRKDSLYNAARISYVIDNPDNNLVNINDQFLHSQNWALVDRNGDVKKIYDGLKKGEVNDLIRDVEKLLGK